MHAGSALDVLIPQASFLDFDLKDKLVYSFVFVDGNSLEGSWIKFNSYIHRISGVSSYNDATRENCKNFVLNETF